jgi:hypothetical protein
LEKNPATVFRKADLLKKSKSQFEELKCQGFLTYVQPDPYHETYPCTLPCSDACPMEVVEMEGRHFAICPKDTEIDPIPLTKDDLARYTFCLSTFLARIQTANKIAGKAQQWPNHYVYLGHKTLDGKKVGLVFAPQLGEAAILTLSGLKKLCREDHVLVVLTPAHQIEDVFLKEKLRQERVIQMCLAPLITVDSFELPIDEQVSELLAATTEDGGPITADSQRVQSLATSWGQISIEIVDDDTIRYRVKDEQWKRANYAELGFKNSKTGLPNNDWETFLLLAEVHHDGYVDFNISQSTQRKQPYGGTRKRAAFMKSKDRICRNLKAYFGPKEVPIRYMKKEKRFQVKFTLSDERPKTTQ